MRLPKSKGVRRESSGGSSGGGIGLPSGIGTTIFAIVGTAFFYRPSIIYITRWSKSGETVSNNFKPWYLYCTIYEQSY